MVALPHTSWEHAKPSWHKQAFTYTNKMTVGIMMAQNGRGCKLSKRGTSAKSLGSSRMTVRNDTIMQTTALEGIRMTVRKEPLSILCRRMPHAVYSSFGFTVCITCSQSWRSVAPSRGSSTYYLDTSDLLWQWLILYRCLQSGDGSHHTASSHSDQKAKQMKTMAMIVRRVYFLLENTNISKHSSPRAMPS